MNCFVDTSALVKNYVTEEGTEEMNAILQQSDRVFVSSVTMIECASVFSMSCRTGRMTMSQAKMLMDEVSYDAVGFEVVPFDGHLENEATRISFDHNLRALDAIQLASALACKHEIKTFVASDKKLLEAAKKEKLLTEDPTE